MKYSYIDYKCPYCNKIFRGSLLGSHIRKDSEKLNIKKDEVRCNIFIETFGNQCKKDEFSKLYLKEKYSLPIFYQKFNMMYHITQFLIKYYGLKKRTFKEAAKIGSQRAKETNLERYGVDQTFKVPEFHNKRKETYLKNYSVDNPFKMKDFLEKAENTYFEKYGMSLREKKGESGRKHWKEKTKKEKDDHLNKSLHSEKAIENMRSGSRYGRMEALIGECLLNMDIPFTSQFKIKKKLFDYRISNTNILIEVNGTIFHADPSVYKPEDVMPVTKKTAKNIWTHDAEKNKLAEDSGYKVIVIWERELKYKSQQQIIELIYERVKNCINKKNQRNS